MNKVIPYYRVSTEKQGQSGLGLDAQQIAVRAYVSTHNLKIIEEFTEIESGKKNRRPILIQALNECKKNHATLLIAKLDRLGRNLAFISSLMESNVDFIAVDNPRANKLIIHIMAAFAEYERDQISKRTKEALAAAKLRGVRLGKYGSLILSKKNKETAKGFAIKMKPIIDDLIRQNYKSIRQITEQLNKAGTNNYSGKRGKWHPTSVYNILKRINSI